MARTRSTWGWGFEDAAFTARAGARGGARDPRHCSAFPAGELEEPVPLERGDAAGAARRASGRRPRGRAARRITASARPTPTASRTSTRSARSAASTSTSRTSSRARATRTTSPRCWSGPRTRTSRSSPTAAGRASSAAWSRGSRRGFDGALSLDLGALDGLLELDTVSRAARIGAGASGPRVEELLGAHGLTMRFFPQSFELSTLGRLGRDARGRALRDEAHAHRRPRRERARDHPVRGVGVAAPAGLGRRALAGPDAARLGGRAGRDHRRVGAGPAAPRAPCLARGALRDVPRRRGGGPRARAVRPGPGQLPADRRARGAADRRRRRDARDPRARLRVHRPPGRRRPRGRAAHLPRARGDARPAARAAGGGGGSVGAWREAFIRMPYLRDLLLRLGVLSDTFETAITWERFPAFHETVMRRRARGARRALPGHLPLHARVPGRARRRTSP